MQSIRLKPIGRKHQRHYRIVVSEKRSKLDGKFTEDIGHYNPYLKEVVIKEDRAKYWLSVGAQPSDTVHNMFVNKKIITEAKIPVHSKSKKTEAELEALAAAAAAKAAKANAAPIEPVEAEVTEAVTEEVSKEEVIEEPKKEAAEASVSEESVIEEAPTA